MLKKIYGNHFNVSKVFADTADNLIKQGIFQTYIAFDNQTLPPFVKIMQSFILMQNT